MRYCRDHDWTMYPLSTAEQSVASKVPPKYECLSMAKVNDRGLQHLVKLIDAASDTKLGNREAHLISNVKNTE